MENGNGRRSETFEQIVQQQYGGNLAAAAGSFGVSGDRLHALVGGRESLEHFNRVTRRIASELGSTAEELFPPALYRHPIFESLFNSPGYKILAEKYQLQKSCHANGHKGKATLKNLCNQKGFSLTAYCRLTQLLIGHLSFSAHTSFCEDAAQKLGVELCELFPLSFYGEAEAERVPFNRRLRSIHDEPEAQERIDSASYRVGAPDADTYEKCRVLVRELLRFLSKEQRIVIQQRFGVLDTEPCTLKVIAPNIGVTTKERTRQVEADALGHLRVILEQCPEFRDQIMEALRMREGNERVFR